MIYYADLIQQNNDEGAEDMGGIMDEMFEEAERQAAERIAERLIKGGELSLESIASAVEIPLEEIQEMAKNIQQQKNA